VVVLSSPLDSIEGWFTSLWDNLSSVEIKYLLLAALFQVTQTILDAVSWYNILRYAYPDRHVSPRPIVAGYAGGVGLNKILPAQLGTLTYLAIFKASIPRSSFPTIVGGYVPQNIFFIGMEVVTFLILIFTAPQVLDEENGQIHTWVSHHRVALIIGITIVVLVALWVYRRFVAQRVHDVLRRAGDGMAILRKPRAYLLGAFLPQALSYVCRIGVNATMLYAFNIPVTVRTIFLVVAAVSLVETFAITPGGVGEQQVVTAAALKNYTSAANATAMSLAQEALVTVVNITFGLLALTYVFGWKGAVAMMHVRSKKGESKEQAQAELEAMAQQRLAEQDAKREARRDAREGQSG
jgi:uncharacterized membrane protein YbhN (UPF0104 family)